MRKTMQRVPLDTGNRIAWAVLALFLGFSGGWVAATMSWSTICFPPM